MMTSRYSLASNPRPNVRRGSSLRNLAWLCRHLLFIILICLPGGDKLAVARADQPEKFWGAEMESALAQAGTNRQELVRALQQAPDSEREGIQFLIVNMPLHDLQSLSASFLLEDVDLAYKVKEKAPWAMNISSEVFLNYILPYANVTEARENWREKLHEICQPLVRNCQTPGEAAHAINRQLFKLVKVKYSMKRRAPDQGPLETMETGVATCTGLSILLVDACRSVGVPARVVGTPLWVNNTGNHTWVEVWDGDWHFTGAAEADPKGFDRGWFVGNASQAIKNDRDHAIYAASFRKTGLSFPLNWAPEVEYVNAVNVTERYTAKSPTIDPSKIRLQVNILDRPMGKRVAAKVNIVDSADSKLHFEGTSKTELADINDHLTFYLPKQRTYLVEAELGDQKNRRYYSPGTNDQDVLLIHLSGVPSVMAPPPAFCAMPSSNKPLVDKDKAKLQTAVMEFFSAPADRQADWKFSKALNAIVLKNESAARQIVWEAYTSAPIHGDLRKSFDENKVRFEDHVSPYTVKTVGKRPPCGWALFIAMHGGGGAPQELNDSQWMKMQRYYRDHPEVGGYRYLALRAPNNEWNGFYASYVYPLIANLVRQFLLFGDVDPNKVFLMGYSHGGYGAFAIGPKMADRFAAIHSSAAALADGAKPQTLRNTPFTCMVGEKDTAYGRIRHAREFDRMIGELRGNRTDIYPVTVSIIADHPHSGLPDREKIAEMYPAVRNPVPRELTWPLTDRVIQDFFWLHVPDPDRGLELDATCRDNRITVQATTNLTGSILLDSRLVDFSKPIWLELNGQTSRVRLKPDLRILCETMQRRGDPDLAFTTQIVLPLKVTKLSNLK